MFHNIINNNKYSLDDELLSKTLKKKRIDPIFLDPAAKYHLSQVCPNFWLTD